MNKRLKQMNKSLKKAKQTLNEGKEGMRKNNKAWRSEHLISRQAFIRLCQNRICVREVTNLNRLGVCPKPHTYH